MLQACERRRDWEVGWRRVATSERREIRAGLWGLAACRERELSTRACCAVAVAGSRSCLAPSRVRLRGAQCLSRSFDPDAPLLLDRWGWGD